MDQPLILTHGRAYRETRRSFASGKLNRCDISFFLEKRADEKFLIGYDSHQFIQRFSQFYLELTQVNTEELPPKIILSEREPMRFIAGLLAACAAGYPVFLCNPNWVETEWKQVFELVQPDIIWGMSNGELEKTRKLSIQNHGHLLNEANPHTALSSKSQIQNSIMIPTGGSSGKIKFAIHTWETLMASVQGFQEYFQLNQVNSFCILPLYHVSGLMQLLRSLTTGGKLAIASFKELEKKTIPSNIDPGDFFISLVPTQLQRLLENPDLTQWLSQFKTVFLGGAPAWEELLEQARKHKIRLAPTYGMTETASQIATLKPDEFLKGKQGCGQILPHAKITICSPTGEKLGVNKPGKINIQTTSLALGYYPNFFPNPNNFQPDDLGIIDNQGYLKIIGRNSNKIITGGENVFPDEVESAIRDTKLVNDVCVIGIPDKHWGQAVTAMYVPINPETSPTQIQTALKDKLTKFKHPKHWLSLTKLPRNPQGKINYQKLQQLVKEEINKHR